MSNSLPVKNIIKLNWVISILSAVLVLILVFIGSGDFYKASLRLLQTFTFLSAVSFSNLGWRIVFKESQAQIRQLRIKFALCSYISVFIIWLFIKNAYSYLTDTKWEGDGPFIYKAYLITALSLWVFNTLILVLQNLVILQHSKAQAEIENLQLKASVSESANLLLRQQIHPHFLFNALNAVKALYKQDFQQGEDYLVHLANFLRVSITSQDTKTTLIKNELAFCLDYLKMQQIRFGSALNYSITISEQTINTRYLPYFSLQPLVENALKHNELTEERPISITITEEDGYLLITNNLQQRRHKEVSTGQGLANLAERYRLLAGEEIAILADTDFFTVRIKILEK